MPRPRKFPCTLTNKYGKVAVYQTRNGLYKSYKIVWQEGPHRRKESRPDEITALNRANEILDDLAKGVPTRKDATGEQWAYYRRCEEMLGPVPLIRAVEYFLEHGTKADALPTISVTDLRDRFIAAKKAANRSERYLEAAGYHLSAVAKVMHKPLALVRVEDLDAYLTTIKDLRTRHNHRVTLVTAWRWARSKGWLPRDLSTAADLTDNPEYTHRDPGIITPDQLKEALDAALTTAARRKMIPYIVIGAFAGVRPAEICRMTWEEHIDLDKGTIILGSDITKMRRRRVIYMEPVLIEWLKAFPSKGKVVKIADPHRRLAELRTTSWPHNALRHSAVSYLMAHHRNAALVADQCGHTEAQLQASYKAITTAEQSLRWFNTKPPIWQATPTQQKAACA